MLSKSQLVSALHFAQEMSLKYTNLFKEWQHYALVCLNDYVDGKMTDKEYCTFIRNYQMTKLRYEHWTNEVSWIKYQLNTGDYNELNDTDRKN